MIENTERTEISNLGEFGLISRITNGIEFQNISSIIGVGDDAAVIQLPEGTQLLVSTDLLLEGVHFDLSYTPLRHLGYKAVVVNISDIVAMGGTPSQIVVSLGLSNRFSVEAVEELYAGIGLACEKYKVDLVGGDTSNSKQGLLINMTALGYAKPDEIIYRSGAGKSDLICVTGDLGAAYLGLQILEREKRVYLENPDAQPDLEPYDYIVGRQLKPECPVELLEDLRKAGIKPTAMMDISDGLASELFHISSQSNVGVVIYEEKLPIDQQTWTVAEEFNLAPATVAYSGGEDYELVFTVPPTDFEKLRSINNVHVIGHCTEPAEGLHTITRSGTRISLEKQGWKAF